MILLALKYGFDCGEWGLLKQLQLYDISFEDNENYFILRYRYKDKNKMVFDGEFDEYIAKDFNNIVYKLK